MENIRLYGLYSILRGYYMAMRLIQVFFISLVLAANNETFRLSRMQRREGSSRTVGDDSTPSQQFSRPVVEMPFDTQKYKEELNKIEQTKQAMKYLQDHSKGGEAKNPDEKPPRRPSQKL